MDRRAACYEAEAEKPPDGRMGVFRHLVRSPCDGNVPCRGLLSVCPISGKQEAPTQTLAWVQKPCGRWLCCGKWALTWRTQGLGQGQGPGLGEATGAAWPRQGSLEVSLGSVLYMSPGCGSRGEAFPEASGGGVSLWGRQFMWLRQWVDREPLKGLR